MTSLRLDASQKHPAFKVIGPLLQPRLQAFYGAAGEVASQEIVYFRILGGAWRRWRLVVGWWLAGNRLG